MPDAYGGELMLLESQVLNPGSAGDFFGQGLVVEASFHNLTQAVAPVLEEQPGSPLGCKLWDLTAAQANEQKVGLDEGTLEATFGGSQAPNMPQCTYVVGAGYVCPFLGTASTGGTVSMGPQPGMALLTDLDVAFNAANTLGTYVRISGAAATANNGVFPVLGLVNSSTVAFANPAVVAELLPATALHVQLAGVGPIPATADPGFLRNDATLSVTLIPGGGNHLAAFTASTSLPGVGDAFMMDNPSVLNNVPLDGSPFTVGCAALTCGPGTAAGTMVTLTTTDAPVGGISPFSLPPPVARQVTVRCVALGTTSVTVPAQYMALLAQAGATRTRARLARVNLLGGAPAGVSVVSGHEVVGFTN